MWTLIGLRELTAGSVQLFRQAGGCWQWKYFVWTSSEVADEEIFDVRTLFFPQYRNYSGHDAAILRTKRDTGCVCPWSMSSTHYFLQALVSIFLFLLSRRITSTSENWRSSNTTRSILTDGVVKKLHPFDLHVFANFIISATHHRCAGDQAEQITQLDNCHRGLRPWYVYCLWKPAFIITEAFHARYNILLFNDDYQILAVQITRKNRH